MTVLGVQAPVHVGKSMYFMTHKHKETRGSDAGSTSYENEGEAALIVAFVKRFLAEGYDATKITVLAMYSGQVRLLRKKLVELHIKLVTRDDTDGVQVLTVDQMQGSENDVVCVSLVRSNDDNQVGFVGTQNRMCVAASRARCGLYFFGNPKGLQSNKRHGHWRDYIAAMAASDCVGSAVPLCCPRHPDESPVLAETPGEMAATCPRVCGADVPCGHRCQQRCHAGAHQLCELTIHVTNPRCAHGHPVRKKCSAAFLPCTEPCSSPVSCGHLCSNR